MIRAFQVLSRDVRRLLKNPFYGFVRGHSHLTIAEIDAIRSLVGFPNPDVTLEFERRFGALIGDGRAVSFAAGRMGFFALLRVLGVGAGDEVLLPGATCAVMANAVLRSGATPVYADIDAETFGSSARHIADRITSRTRMIVVQHSFGIPCDIESAIDTARNKNIFVLEDCALTIGSTLDGVVVGNFGDAALFSTDHSKPINTMIGGLVFTKDPRLAAKLCDIQVGSGELPDWKQKALWARFVFELANCRPSRYGSVSFRDDLAQTLSFRGPSPFLDGDAGSKLHSVYPYPAKMPAFLAAVGSIELNSWMQRASERCALLARLLATLEYSPVRAQIPAVYRDRRRKIVPLRLAWTQPDGAELREKFSSFIDVSGTWFMRPIVSATEELEYLGYRTGDCPVSERVGPGMINIPCDIEANESNRLVQRLDAALEAHARMR